MESEIMTPVVFASGVDRGVEGGEPPHEGVSDVLCTEDANAAWVVEEAEF